jgi:hypothetical protein
MPAKGTCEACGAAGRIRIGIHKDHKELTQTAEDGNQGWTWTDWWETSWHLAQCLRCKSVFTEVSSTCSDDRDHESGELVETISRRVVQPWPETAELDVGAFPNLPDQLGRLYLETIAAYQAGALGLAAVGLRACVEAIAKGAGVDGGLVPTKDATGITRTRFCDDLRGKIAGLSERKLIMPAQAEGLHQIRFLGNDAAHVTDFPSVAELGAALRLLRHLLEGLYEIWQPAAIKQIRS